MLEQWVDDWTIRYVGRSGRALPERSIDPAHRSRTGARAHSIRLAKLSIESIESHPVPPQIPATGAGGGNARIGHRVVRALDSNGWAGNGHACAHKHAYHRATERFRSWIGRLSRGPKLNSIKKSLSTLFILSWTSSLSLPPACCYRVSFRRATRAAQHLWKGLVGG